MGTVKEPDTLEDWLAEEEAKDPAWKEKFEAGLPGASLGSRLAVRREDLGLSRAQLAQRSGIKSPMIARIEQSQEPNLTTLRRLAKALDAVIVIVIRPDGDMRVGALQSAASMRAVAA